MYSFYSMESVFNAWCCPEPGDYSDKLKPKLLGACKCSRKGWDFTKHVQTGVDQEEHLKGTEGSQCSSVLDPKRMASFLNIVAL